MSRAPSAGAVRLLGTAHLWVGLVAVAAFLLTGQYMDRVLDHLRGMDDARRMIFRSVHIYLMLAALLNLVLGIYVRPLAGALARMLQVAGSLPILVAPALLLQAFFTEPRLTGLVRPYTEPALYGLLGGAGLHLLAAWVARTQARAGPGARPPERPRGVERQPTVG